jgi:hypothetical protein
MGQYDSRRVTLDPGRTALALRGLKNPEGHYPFIDDAARRRSRPRRLAHRPMVTRETPQGWLGTLYALLTRRRSAAPA